MAPAKNSDYIIGLDQGTTGTTALLLDRNQKIIQKSYLEHQQYFPQPGWVEHDPTEIFRNVIEVIRRLIAAAQIPPHMIHGIGITNQRETIVMWEKSTSKPVHHAIVWQCRRTSDACEKFSESPQLANRVQQITGLTIDPYFSATKISWLLQNTNAQTHLQDIAVGTIDSWLLWNFTKGKVHATDITNASRTMIFDIREKKWSNEMLKVFNIPHSILPEVKSSSSEFGFIDPSYFGHAIPILGMIGDQQSALFGHGTEAKCTFGTGAFALVHCGDHPVVSKNNLLTTLAIEENGSVGYAIEGSVFMAGSIMQWLRDDLKIVSSAKEVDELAVKIPNNEGVYLVPAFVGLGAPYWKSKATASLSGMRMGTNRSHVARAALESIAYQIHDLFHAMEQDTGHTIQQLAVDGGVANSHFLMQFLSDILHIPILKNRMLDMTSFGAARLAAKHLGWNFSSSTESEIFKPQISPGDRQRNLEGWKKAVSITIDHS